jgi:hypothetical protein
MDAAPKAPVNVHAFPPQHSERGRYVAAEGSHDLRSSMFACFPESDVCHEVELLQKLPNREHATVNSLLVAADVIRSTSDRPTTTVMTIGTGSGSVPMTIWQHETTVDRVVAVEAFPPHVRLQRLAKCLSRRDPHERNTGANVPTVVPEEIAKISEEDGTLIIVNAALTWRKEPGPLATCAVRSSTKMTDATSLFSEVNLTRVYCPRETEEDKTLAAGAPGVGELVFDVPATYLSDLVDEYFTKSVHTDGSRHLLLHIDTHGIISATGIVRQALDTLFAPAAAFRPDVVAVEVYPPRDLAAAVFEPERAGGQIAHHAVSTEDEDADDEESLEFMDLLVGQGYIAYVHHIQTFVLKAASQLTFMDDAHHFHEWREVNIRINTRPQVRLGGGPILAAQADIRLPQPGGVLLGSAGHRSGPRHHRNIRRRGEHSDARHPGNQVRLGSARGRARVGGHHDRAAGDERRQGAWREPLRRNFACHRSVEGGRRRAEVTLDKVRIVDVGGLFGVDAVKGAQANVDVTLVQSSPRNAFLGLVTMCLNDVSATDQMRTPSGDIPRLQVVQAVVAGSKGPCEVHQSMVRATGTQIYCEQGGGRNPRHASVAWKGTSTTIDELLGADRAMEATDPREHTILLLSRGFTPDVLRGAGQVLE